MKYQIFYDLQIYRFENWQAKKIKKCEANELNFTISLTKIN